MGIAGRLSKFFLHSQLTPLIALVALLLGLFAVLVTPREEEPQINVTMANVLIPFPGASARDVEQLVATPAEQVIGQMHGIDHVFSVSKPGMAVVTVQFKVGVPRTEALVRLYDVVNANRDWLPRELNVGEPLVKPKGIDDVPVLSLTLWTRDGARGAYELERVAHAMEAELKRVPGTREVATLGGPGRVVRVLLDIDKLSAHHLAVNDIRQALLGVNAAMPSGQLAQDNRMLDIETGNFLASAREVEQLIVGVSEGNPVFLADVARVVDGPAQPSKYVWFGTGKAGSGADASTPVGGEYPAVTIAITKKPGENAVRVAEQVTRRIAELRNTVLPAGVEVAVTRNYGETANDKAMKLIQKLLFATSAVVVLVYFALGRREAMIVGVAVVLTLAATLFASWAWGFTLNRVSLFALIFSIGILVDDAIVVVENIHRHRLLTPERALAEIIPLAVDEVGGPTILATFTVIAALLPMAFVTGLMGPYMSPIPINASMGMVISLVIAFTVTPWLAYRFARGDGAHASEATTSHGAADAADAKLHGWFGKLLLPFLAAPKAGRNRRWLWLGIVAAIALSVGLAVVQLVVLKMLPFDNKSEFQVVLDMPAGTPLENTAAALREMGAYLSKVDEVTDYQGYAGTSAPINFNGLVRQYYLRQAPEFGDLQVNLVDKHRRARKSHEIAGSVRAGLEKIAFKHGAKVKVVEVPPGPPVMAPLVAEIYGPDEAGRHALAKQVRQALGETADIVGIDDSIEDAAAKDVLKVDLRKAALLGIPAFDVVRAMRVALAGEDVTALHDGQSKYAIPVRLTLPAEKQTRLDTLLAMTLKSSAGDNVPLAELVQVRPDWREKTIYHKDMLPVSYVMGDMAGKLDSPLYGMFAARAGIAKLAAASGPSRGRALGEYFISQPSDPYRQYAIKWDGEWQITYETFRDMGLAYAVGLVLVYILVVAQFGSYLTPLIIMAPIPLTIIGVMPGHALLGAQYTATSMIGMIALAGIIVRNSILLVDFIDLQVARGMPFVEAVVGSAAARAKPIVLTGLAAIIGAFFILDDPIFNGLAISLIFGILVSTLLTLVVIPVLYYAANRRKFA